jgi:hypothetical protein
LKAIASIHRTPLARGWSQRRAGLRSPSALCRSQLRFCECCAVPAIVLRGCSHYPGAGNLRYHEVDELRASVRRNLSDRRLRAINNLRIRRACQSLSSADQLSDLFDAIVEVVEAGEFVTAEVELSCNGQMMINARALELAREDGRTDHQSRWYEGHIQWKWRRQPASQSSDFAQELWTVRLPICDRNSTLGHLSLSRALQSEPLLFDVNYLTKVFQPAITDAAQRIFDEAEQSMPRQRAASDQHLFGGSTFRSAGRTRPAPRVHLHGRRFALSAIVFYGLIGLVFDASSVWLSRAVVAGNVSVLRFALGFCGVSPGAERVVVKVDLRLFRRDFPVAFAFLQSSWSQSTVAGVRS